MASKRQMCSATLCTLVACAGLPLVRGDATAQVAKLEQQVEANRQRIRSLEEYVNEPMKDMQFEPRQLYVLEDFSIYPTATGGGGYSFRTSIEGAMDHMWGVICGILTLFMQAGLIIMQAGYVRFKNVQTIIYKNVMTVIAVTIVWYTIGYMFALGGPFDSNGDLENGGFVGNQRAFADGFNKSLPDGQKDPTINMVRWFASWSRAIISATIIPGAVAERINIPGITLIACLYSIFIYPLQVAWSTGFGWIHQLNDVGPHDQAGGAHVFLTGGVVALVGAAMMGRRDRRFGPLKPLESEEPQSALSRFVGDVPDEFHPHSLPLVVIGGFMIWFGFYGFACGSTESMANVEQGFVAGLIAMNVTLSAACGGLTAFVIRSALKKRYDIATLSNGIVAGLVSVSSCCNSVEPGAAVAIGILGGLVHILAGGAVRAARIDDVTDSFATYGASGMWSAIAAPFFDMGKGFDSIHHRSSFRCITLDGDDGCSKGLWGQYFSANILMIFMIWIWASAISSVGFLFLKYAFPESTEQKEHDAVEKDGADSAFIVRPAYYKGEDWREVI